MSARPPEVHLPIRTSRLVLRGYRLDDAEALLGYYPGPGRGGQRTVATVATVDTRRG